jgi:hypothetical protein
MEKKSFELSYGEDKPAFWYFHCHKPTGSIGVGTNLEGTHQLSASQVSQ